MKKTTLLLCVISLIAVLSSCVTRQSTDQSASKESINDRITGYESVIANLENQIYDLQQEQYLSGVESDKKIEELGALLEELKDRQDKEHTDGELDGGTNISPGFKYIVSGSSATITGYTGEDKNLVIPSSVDGYRVSSIADGAFENTDLRSVIISDGIETIGWFAFNGCASLSSVTIPSSVKSIGYSAFGDAKSILTVYCHSDSFALSYAKSYGLTYTVI